jgi:cell division protein ZipA
VSELRWILLGAGLLVLGLIWLLGRSAQLRQRLAALASVPSRPATGAAPPDPAPAPEPPRRPAPGAEDIPRTRPVRIVTVRVVGRQAAGIPAESLLLALRDAGLRHGRLGIFHRVAADDEAEEVFSVASLVEPGSFDLTRLKDHPYPGVSLFLALPGPRRAVEAFDDMLATARGLAAALDGDLLDEQGSRLSVQRERYLREEVIQFQLRQPGG